MDPLHPTYRNLLYFIDRNSHNLATIRQAAALNPNDNEWLELLEFRKHFEEMLERLTDDITDEDMDDLIWRGLALKSSITAIE
jgi:bifunctional ADP-heptose synthase (sugar kinase/adenylyltransferase)